MIQYVKINLLPYKEQEEQEKKKQFNRLMVLALVVSLLVVVVIYLFLSQLVDSQMTRNQFLTQEIQVLDQQIVKVRELQNKKKAFLVRKTAIEELQNERFTAARVFNELNTLLPEGVYLTQIKSDNEIQYTLTGRSFSHNKIAHLMSSLPSTGVFEIPQLVSIKSDQDAQVFTIKTQLINRALMVEAD